MKKYIFFLMCTLGMCIEGLAQNASVLPASKRLIPRYDSLHDDRHTRNSNLVKTAKGLLLSYMDSLEKMFGVSFDTMPFVKFGSPRDILPDDYYLYAGHYRSKEFAIYFTSQTNYLRAVPLGTAEQYQHILGRKDFKETAVHELGHWVHDLFIRRLTGKKLPFINSYDHSKQTIETAIIAEGIATWIELKYQHADMVYKPPQFMPYRGMSWEKDWETYALSVVGRILDVDAKRGLEYLVTHRFEVIGGFAESVQQYQTAAINFLNTPL